MFTHLINNSFISLFAFALPATLISLFCISFATDLGDFFFVKNRDSVTV